MSGRALTPRSLGFVGRVAGREDLENCNFHCVHGSAMGERRPARSYAS
jgi:hypothetical protein